MFLVCKHWCQNSELVIYCIQEADQSNPLLEPKHISVEFASFSDGKEAVAKAANLLFRKYLKLGDSDKIQEEKIFTEAGMTEALKAVGLWYLSDLLVGLQRWSVFKFLYLIFWYWCFSTVRLWRTRTWSLIGLWTCKMPSRFSCLENSIYRDHVSDHTWNEN